MADWQFCESQDRVSFMMNHVASVQANLNPIQSELAVFSVDKVSSVSNVIMWYTVEVQIWVMLTNF